MDSSVTLNYIDKLSTTLYDTGKLINRSMTIFVSLSILLLGFQINFLSMQNEITLSGAKFIFPEWVILIILSWLLVFSFMKFVGLIGHESYLMNEIRRLYKKIGFEDASLNKVGINPIEYPNLFTLYFCDSPFRENKVNKLISTIFVLGGFIILIFPILVQAFVAYMMITKENQNWYLISSFSFALLFMIISIIFLINYKSKITNSM